MTFSFLGTSTAAGWHEWDRSNVAVVDDAVVLRSDAFPAYVSPTLAIEDPPPGFVAVDVAQDRCGQLYVLGGDARVYRYDDETDVLERLPCLGDDEWVGTPSALCVTRDSLYVATQPRADGDGGTEPTEPTEPTDVADDAGGEGGDAGDATDETATDGTADDGTADDEGAADGTAGDGTADDEAATEGTTADDGATGGRVYAFSTALLHLRWVVDGPVVDPVALAEHDGAVYLLDRGRGPGDGRLATVGAGGTVESVAALDAPTDLAIDDAGALYALDHLVENGDGAPAVRKFAPDHAEITDETYPLTAFEVGGGGTFEPVCLAVRAADELLLGVGPDPLAERSLFRYVAATGTFERLASFKRSCSALLLGRGSTGGTEGTSRGLYAIDGDDAQVFFLREAVRYRPNEPGASYTASLVRRLDSGIRDLQWHRVTLDSERGGPRLQVRLRYYATDDPDEEIDALERISGIGPTYAGRLRAAGVTGITELAELTLATVAAAAEAPEGRVDDWLVQAQNLVGRWTTLTNPEDALLDDADGRYLWVRLDLFGSEYASPRVESFRAYFPRQSYLRHLPAIYRADPESAAFLERFLSLFESTFVGVEEEFAAITRYLDPRGIPPEFLSWLGGWLAVGSDETWPDAATRDLLSRAPELFTKRGTREGLLAVLGLYLAHVEPEPRAGVETGVDRGGGGDEETTGGAADATASHGDGAVEVFLFEDADLDCIDDAEVRARYERIVSCQQCFLVLVPPTVGDEAYRTVRRIVERERPAHTAGRAVRLQPWIKLGGNAYLGVNSVLPRREFVLERAGLGTDSILAEREAFAQLGRQSRVGEDTLIS